MSWLAFGLFLCCTWSVFHGWRYFNQMKEWRQRATLAEHALRCVRQDLKSQMGHVSIELEALVDDVVLGAGDQ